MTVTSRAPRFPVGLLFLTATLMLFTGCKKTTPIKTLLDDPTRFDGETVRIVGEVKSSLGAIVFGAYQVDDGTGTLTVVSDAGAPRTGAKVGVEGRFRAGFTIGAETAAVLVEDRRYTP